MALRKVEKKDFVYFSYTRENSKDLEDFRREMVNEGCSVENCKDVVLDLTAATTFSSAELSILIRLLKSMEGKERFLRLITPAHIKKIIVSTNINKLKNIQLYDDLENMCNQLQNG
ncbi:hypothetical protein CHISP_2029 [Chitinispirillum alkaliphilum]|nr:hypothetical protein CHISP_2029 [Chitinispirillum alkaliphilum]